MRKWNNLLSHPRVRPSDLWWGPGHCPMISKHAGSQYSKTCLTQPLKKDTTKILITNDSLMKVKRIAECSPCSILQYFRSALSDYWSSFLSGRLRQVLLYNQQSIYIYAYKCLCQSVLPEYQLWLV